MQNLTEALARFFEKNATTETTTTTATSENFALLADDSIDEAQREQLGVAAWYKVPKLAEIKEENFGFND